jgi:hypothetical protein
VVTLMTDAQVTDVRDLTRKAGISATITRLRPGHPLLTELAPGERTYVAPTATPAPIARPPRRPRPTGTTSRPARRARPAKSNPPAATGQPAGMAAFSAGTRGRRRR